VSGRWLPAVGLVAVGTAAATAIGQLDFAPSPIAVALVLGLAASPWAPLGEGSQVSTIGKLALRTGVVLLGFRITVDDLTDLGAATIVLAVGVSLVVLAATVWIGRRLDLGRRLSTLLGIGSAICGASAVAAAGTTMEASEEETAYAIATVTLIGTVATFALPALGSWVGLDDRELGIWIGMMVHDVGQVVAASTAVGDAALTAAVPVKLVRVLLLVPVLVVLAGSSLRATPDDRAPQSASARRLYRLIPAFVALFILASVISSTGVIPDGLADLAADVEKILFTAALFAIGISVHAPTLRRIGLRPALTSAAIWSIAALTTLGILRA
jgi:uncharacterized integral membrane protein (TIGR00698 family)